VLTDPRGAGNRRGRTAPLVVGLVLLGLSCGGSPSGTCQARTCANAAAGTYQICSQANGNVDYSVGGELCTCLPGNANQCLLCAQILAGYCGSAPTGASSCAATFSGAFNGTAPSCAVTIMYAPAAGVSSVTAKGVPLAGTPYTWGANFVLDGVPEAGTFDQTQAVEAIAVLTGDSGLLPDWVATINSGQPTGDATLEIASTGPAVDVDGQTFYGPAHGTWTGKLGDQNSQTAQPDVELTVAF